MSFVVDPTSISNSDILKQLESFVASRPDADSWQTFFEAGVGSTVLRLLAGIEAYNTFNNIVGRREAFMHYAKNRSSIVGGAQYKGYSAFRGRNPIVVLTITPNFTGTIPRFGIVGAVKSQELVALETKVVNAGFSTTLLCVLGDVKSETLKATSNKPALFRYTGNGTTSDTIRVLVDGDEVSLSTRFADLSKFKFISQTNAVGSVDIFSTNEISAPVRYDAGSDVTLEWIELKQIEYASTDFSFLFGDITNIVTESAFTDPEENVQVVIRSTLQYETQFVIRAREDQPKQLRLLDTSIIDAKGEDVSAAIMRLFYLRTGGLLFNQTETQKLVDSYETYRGLGMAPPLIDAPTRIPLKIRIDAVLQDSSGDPENDIKAITQPYAYKLEGSIRLDDLEQDIEELQNVKIARPKFAGTTWNAGTKFEKGQHGSPTVSNGRIYQVAEILYFSGGSEPTWPTVNNASIVDGDIVWRAIPKNDTAGISAWAFSAVYRVGNQVKPSVANGFIYEAIEVQNKSEASEPTWSPLAGKTPAQLQGAETRDGDILWIARPIVGTPATWSANTVYRKGDCVVATNPVASDVSGVMFQALAYLGTPDSDQPAWPTTLGNTVDDNSIRWICQDPLQAELSIGKGEYFTIEEDIVVS